MALGSPAPAIHGGTRSTDSCEEGSGFAYGEHHDDSAVAGTGECAVTTSTDQRAALESFEDRITVSPRTSVETAAQRIKSAMRRNPYLDDTHIAVTIIDDTAVLTGSVPSPAQLAQAALATGASPEVTRIDNRLRVRSR